MPQRPSHSHQNSIDDNPWLAGFFIAVFVFLGFFVLSLRYHISTLQWVEGGVYIVLLLASIWLLFAWRSLDRNRDREPFRMPLDQDELEVERAADQGAVLLGYTLDKAPVIWTDRTRAMQALLCGMNGSGKTTMLENIVSQDLRRMVGPPGKRRHLPMVIFDGKGDAKFLDKMLPHIQRAGRMHQLRIIAPSRPDICARYNPFFAPDGRYMERVNMVFGSFSMRRDFFTKHQFDYLSNIVRILYYTGRRYNFYDVIVMMHDEIVLREQIAIAEQELARNGNVTAQSRLNFEMSVRTLLQSFEDRERVPKIQGLINECMTFTDDDLAAITSHYDDLFCVEEVVENDLILLVSLNANRNTDAVISLGRMILQNIQLTIGKLYEDLEKLDDPHRPLFSVILDEFPAFSYKNFAHIQNTARGSKTGFLFSMQAVPQLDDVARGFRESVTGAGVTTMMYRIKDEDTAKFFLRASAEQKVKSRTVQVQKPMFGKFRETGVATESDKYETRSKDFSIKNLPIGRFEMLMGDDSIGMIHTTVQGRLPTPTEIPDFKPEPFCALKPEDTPNLGAHLRFKDANAQKEFKAKRKEFQFKR